MRAAMMSRSPVSSLTSTSRPEAFSLVTLAGSMSKTHAEARPKLPGARRPPAWV